MNKSPFILIVAYLSVVLLGFIGWIKCIINLIGCDFAPAYKAEVLYAIGSFIPVIGAILGWIDFGK